MSQTVLYPLKFKPIFKDKIWGGRKIKEVLGMDYGPLPNCGEVWLLSGIWDEQSEIANGDFEGDEINDLVETFMGDLVGESVFDKYGEQFPLLLKIIDANDWLSVQVTSLSVYLHHTVSDADRPGSVAWIRRFLSGFSPFSSGLPAVCVFLSKVLRYSNIRSLS